MKFRKKPVVIDARQLTDANGDELAQWIHSCGGAAGFNEQDSTLYVYTLESRARHPLAADIGDWIIKGIAGEFYPCKPDIFAATYEPVEYPSSPQKPSADELTKFENWAKGKNLPTMPNGDVYVHVESQMAWEAWQARAKLRDVSPARGGGE